MTTLDLTDEEEQALIQVLREALPARAVAAALSVLSSRANPQAKAPRRPGGGGLTAPGRVSMRRAPQTCKNKGPARCRRGDPPGAR
jgi:hypothetical protein